MKRLGAGHVNVNTSATWGRRLKMRGVKMNACDLLNGSSFRKLLVNGVHYTDGAPGTKAPSAYRWDLICSSCRKSWSVLGASARWIGGPVLCECGGTGLISGVPAVAHRG